MIIKIMIRLCISSVLFGLFALWEKRHIRSEITSQVNDFERSILFLRREITRGRLVRVQGALNFPLEADLHK